MLREEYWRNFAARQGRLGFLLAVACGTNLLGCRRRPAEPVSPTADVQETAEVDSGPERKACSTGAESDVKPVRRPGFRNPLKYPIHALATVKKEGGKEWLYPNGLDKGKYNLFFPDQALLAYVEAIHDDDLDFFANLIVKEKRLGIRSEGRIRGTKIEAFTINDMVVRGSRGAKVKATLRYANGKTKSKTFHYMLDEINQEYLLHSIRSP